MASARVNPGWGSWAWTPAREELQAHVGEFESARLGQMQMPLTPAREVLFGARESEIEVPEALEYDTRTLRWRDYAVERVSPLKATHGASGRTALRGNERFEGVDRRTESSTKQDE